MNVNGLTSLEEKVLGYIEYHEEETVELLQKLVRYQTVNPPGNEAECSMFIADQLRNMGIQPQLVEAQLGRPNIIAALPGGRAGPSLCFYGGHIDVVPPGDTSEWKFHPFAGIVHDGWIYGRGSADHKGCIAASLAAIKSIRDLNISLAGDLIYTVVVDEETGGTYGAKYLVDQGLLYGDLGLYASPGKMDQIIIGSKGLLQLHIRVRGRGTHGGSPWLGVNPIVKASKLVMALQDLKLNRENPWFKNSYGMDLPGTGALSSTIIRAGEKINVIPEYCYVGIDRRLIPEESVQGALDEINQIIAELSKDDPDFQAEVWNVENSCEAVFVSPSNPMVDILKEATGELGISAQISTSFGTSDTRWIVNQGRIPMVAYGGGFLGPDGNLCIHTKDECIKIDDLTMMAKMFALVIIRSCGINQD